MSNHLFVFSILQTEETREVCHMLYTVWPDYGVPQSARALLQFLSLVRQQQNNLLANRGDTWAGHPRGPPIVVHCSAGIGRTGKWSNFHKHFINDCQVFSFIDCYFCYRNVLYFGYLYRPSGGHWYSGRTRDSGANSSSASLQHPDARTVRVLPQGVGWICVVARHAEPPASRYAAVDHRRGFRLNCPICNLNPAYPFDHNYVLSIVTWAARRATNPPSAHIKTRDRKEKN